ncbi:zinc finger BED domain-containing protein RICESLEEPER 3-like [Mercurialis annua]|uniref:zinc finger BED domain-containing protein RICESLEEPER 3-like n=1 Tax=Mercurialis annua TaxID=3986 RepID=UPI00216107CA|nr:zinc finger BED domain-containing protein RICESLEEPER 3-like [Mercurialis annua]
MDPKEYNRPTSLAFAVADHSMAANSMMPTVEEVRTGGSNIAPIGTPNAPVDVPLVVKGSTIPLPVPAAAHAPAEVTGVREKKPMVTRSHVWEHYERVYDEYGRVMSAKCLYCARVYQCHSKLDGTSTLRAHMLACLKNPHAKHTRQTLLTLTLVAPVCSAGDDNDNRVNVGSWKFCQEVIREALAYMIIVDELPLGFVEGVGSKKLMLAACPRFKITSRWTVTRDCFKMYEEQRLKLKLFLKNHRQRGEYISKSLENCLVDWGLKNVFSITMDNASSNDTVVSAFKKKLNQWGTGVAKGKYLHMRCIAHILNLVVSDGLKDVNVSIKKVRDCVRYIRNSPARLRKFREAAGFVEIETKKSLCLDV